MGRFLTAANLLSLSRIPLAGVVWFDPDNPVLVIAVMAAAAITDVLDGPVARAAYARKPDPEAARVGGWLDPLADKLFIASMLGVLLFVARPPWWTLALVGTRELLQVPMYVVYRIRRLSSQSRYDFKASALGKACTVAQFVTVGFGVAGHAAFVPLAVATSVLGVVAIADYVRRARSLV